MKAKTMVELLTLSASIYMLTRDEKFMKSMSELYEKGKEKWEKLTDNSEDEEEKMVQKLLHKAKEAKEEFEHKMEEVAKKMYEKINLTHTDRIKSLEKRIDELKKELALTENRVAQMEFPKE